MAMDQSCAPLVCGGVGVTDEGGGAEPGCRDELPLRGGLGRVVPRAVSSP